MLEAARDRLGEPSLCPVSVGGQALPFRDGSFDAVTCQLGLKFFPDPALGLKEFRRVLRPGGCAAALADPKRLEHLLASAGFRDIRVEREEREDIVESFDDYWAPIETGAGSIPQAYFALSEPDRRSVREEVRERLSQFESNGRLLMSVEMLIGSGRA